MSTGAQRILELGQAFCLSRTLMSAVELGVFSCLREDCCLDEKALRDALGLHPRGTRDFFDALVALKLLDRDGDGRYRNTSEAAAYLDPSQPGYVGDWIEMASTRLYSGWSRLSEALRTGRSQSDIDSTGDAARHYQVLYAEPERRDRFLRAMSGSSVQAAQEIATRFPWHDYYSVADIGCAEGTS
jgi:hypothetical protein